MLLPYKRRLGGVYIVDACGDAYTAGCCDEEDVAAVGIARPVPKHAKRTHTEMLRVARVIHYDAVLHP